MLKYRRVNFWGFDFEINELFGHATLYIYSSEYDRKNVLFKYVDEEHGIQTGGYFSCGKAKREFKNIIKELAV
ncbi:MAG: hypothetical protein LUG16_03795 [Candidatus Gastranaerophilales bacterium]|nr:hypothetical protein [Candidatus Gastranaerophilales bacterium]